MNETDSRLKEFSIALKKSIKELEDKEAQNTDNAVLDLWPLHSKKRDIEKSSIL